MSKLLLEEAADWLEKKQDIILENASKKIFNIIPSYKSGKISLEESRETMRRTLRYIISFLRLEDVKIDHNDPVFSYDVIEFEDGIASKRIRSDVALEDLLIGIRIFRDEVWSQIFTYINGKEESKPQAYPYRDFFVLEKRVNHFIHFMINKIAESYYHHFKKVIGSQEQALEKWEKVVESTSDLTLTIPCSEKFASIVRVQAEALSKRLQFNEDEVMDIVMAVGEACDNAIEHGKSEKGVLIKYTITKDELKIEVIDSGPGFNPYGKGTSPPDLLEERGRGIFIMKTLMDKAEIYSKPGEGCVVELIKKRKPKK